MALPKEDLLFLDWQARWHATARPDQIPPETDWTEMGIQAGRGWGKTKVGAEWLGKKAYRDTERLPHAVIAPTLNDVRFTCFEGHSGLLNVIPPELVEDYNKTNLQIKLTNGVAIRGFSAEEPERLRGPQFAALWCFVAGTQVATPEGQVPIEALRPGDLVLTRKGPRRVLANSRRKAQVGEVSFENGAKLVGTADHPVYLSYGWTRLDQLAPGDEACALRAWSGAANAGTGTETTTTNAPTRAGAPKGPSTFIGSGGWLKSDPFRPDIASIIGTAIRRTTLWKTWSASLRRTMPGTTGLSSRYPGKTGAACLSGRFPALTAEKLFGGNRTSPSLFAPGAPRYEPTPSVRSKKRAPSAVAPSYPATETFALSVASTWRPSGEQSVFCLKVADEPEYFANGVLVHNCDELAAWSRDEETWDMAMFGLRLGRHPQVMWTSTPKPKTLIRKLTEPKPGRIIIRGSTYDNRENLAPSFFEALKKYEGTKLGRQELEGELIDAEEGGIIARSWFKLWPASKPLPKFEWIIMSLDTAFTEKTLNKRTHDPDPSACAVFGIFWHEDVMNVLVLDCWSDHLGMPELISRVKRELNVAYGDDEDVALIKPMFGPAKPMTSGRKPDLLIIEDKGSGISLRQSLSKEGIHAYPYNPGRADKLARLHMVSHLFARGYFWLPESEKRPGRPRTWVEPALDQLCSFRGGGSIKHDDFVDVFSQAARVIMDKGLLSGVKRESKSVREAPAPPKPRVNPYAI